MLLLAPFGRSAAIRITKYLLDIIDILVLLQVSLWAMLKVNVKFKLKLFNLGWFEISFVS